MKRWAAGSTSSEMVASSALVQPPQEPTTKLPRETRAERSLAIRQLKKKAVMNKVMHTRASAREDPEVNQALEIEVPRGPQAPNVA